MTTTTEVTASRPVTSEREALLHRAVQSSKVLGQVMRRATQQIRGELLTDPSSAGEPNRGEQDTRPEIGHSQFFVLHILAQAGNLSVGEIAERSHVAVPTISRMLNQLEEKGLIERRIDATNRRSIRVALTEAGRVAQAQMTRRMEAALEQVLSPLTDAELTDLITAFGHLERLVAQEEATP